MAGGFTVAPEKLEEFKDFMMNHVGKQAVSQDTNIETIIDGVLTVQGARPDFVNLIHNHIGPFGQEHPEPLFLLNTVRIHTADVVGDAHIRTMVSGLGGRQPYEGNGVFARWGPRSAMHY